MALESGARSGLPRRRPPGRPAGSAPTICVRTGIAPAEPPITMMSRPGIPSPWWSARTVQALLPAPGFAQLKVVTPRRAPSHQGWFLALARQAALTPAPPSAPRRPRSASAVRTRGVQVTWQRIVRPRRLVASRVSSCVFPRRQSCSGWTSEETGRPISRWRKCRSRTSSSRRPQILRPPAPDPHAQIAVQHRHSAPQAGQDPRQELVGMLSS